MCFEMNCWRCERSFRHVTAIKPISRLPCGGSRAYVCVRFFLRILQLGKKYSIIYVVQSKRRFQRFDSSLELSIQVIKFIQHAISHYLAHQSY